MADDEVTILAVDDLPQNLRLLDAVLSPRGYRVLTASSGEEALAMLQTAGADLVLRVDGGTVTSTTATADVS